MCVDSGLLLGRRAPTLVTAAGALLRSAAAATPGLAGVGTHADGLRTRVGRTSVTRGARGLGARVHASGPELPVEHRDALQRAPRKVGALQRVWRLDKVEIAPRTHEFVNGHADSLLSAGHLRAAVSNRLALSLTPQTEPREELAHGIIESDSDIDTRCRACQQKLNHFHTADYGALSSSSKYDPRRLVRKLLEALLTVRLLLAFVFMTSAISKLVDLRRFVRIVRSYALMPPAAVAPAAIALTGLEATLGVMFLQGADTRVAATGAALLLALFAGAIATNVARGNRIDCGCGAWNASGQASWLLVARNGLIATGACLLAVRPPESIHALLANHRVTAVSLIAVVCLAIAIFATSAVVRSVVELVYVSRALEKNATQP